MRKVVGFPLTMLHVYGKIVTTMLNDNIGMPCSGIWYRAIRKEIPSRTTGSVGIRYKKNIRGA